MASQAQFTQRTNSSHFGPAKRKRTGFATHRILTGPVEKVKEWMARLPAETTYVIYGRLLNPIRLVPGALQSTGIALAAKSTFILEDFQSNSRLRCSHFEVDTPMPHFTPGTFLRVVGVPLSDGSIVVVDVRHEDSADSVHVNAVAQQSERGFFLATASEHSTSGSSGLSQKQIIHGHSRLTQKFNYTQSSHNSC